MRLKLSLRECNPNPKAREKVGLNLQLFHWLKIVEIDFNGRYFDQKLRFTFSRIFGFGLGVSVCSNNVNKIEPLRLTVAQDGTL
jgi:hypothetical protein